MIISSLENNTVKQLRKLHQKKYREAFFLSDNELLINEAKDKGYLDTLIYVNKKPFDHSNEIQVTKEVMEKISMKSDVEYIGKIKVIEENDNYGNKIIILDHLQDPLNIGKIMEACMLFGFDSIILSKQSADLYNDKCLDNCKGGLFKLNIAHKDLEKEIPILQSKCYKVMATGLRDNTKELHELSNDNKIAIIMGNEGSGVSKNIMDLADEIIKIDMCNIDSLNVSMAASIVMYHFSSI